MLDARPRRLDAVAGAGNDDFAGAGQPSDDGPDRVVAPIAGALGLRHGELHELHSRLVGGGNHEAQIRPVSSESDAISSPKTRAPSRLSDRGRDLSPRPLVMRAGPRPGSERLARAATSEAFELAGVGLIRMETARTFARPPPTLVT